MHSLFDIYLVISMENLQENFNKIAQKNTTTIIHTSK